MRRRAVIHHAMELLVSEGPAGLTPAAVAARTGLARTSVYQYFPTRKDLLGAAVEELFVASQASVTEALRQAGADAPTRLSAYVRATLETARRGHNPTRLVAVELSDASRVRLRELHEQAAAPLRELVAQAGAADVETTAALAQGVINGAVALVEHGADLDHVTAETLRFLHRALD